ncbi:AAA family ATPase [Sporosarcina sp. GW1-11]|uniref:UvrD-helicase domain-containing protein n=1 Tax=Sporosarcina sp. GW1-11 TaxID=2899126 RepID=UPI00294E135D|nr:UvrD-helicase domain-containing protein [Sporosarcina sp. GW1-11]MDV6379257.1 AAA family ATPase [Sporosarcina sp. GW1-11]
MDSTRDNLVIIQAPAGSGKTTSIEIYLKDKISNDKFKKKVLCITYTKRAAEELQSRISHDLIHISTIHSFLSKFFSNHFREPQVIDIYLEYKSKEIEEELTKYHASFEETAAEKPFSYEKYAELEEQYGYLSTGNIKDILNANGLIYNERIWSNCILGELSHDDLLTFAQKCISRIEKLSYRLRSTYEEIIIDEYQDTHSDVIALFYETVKVGDTKLKLIGDQMQNIYKVNHLNIKSLLDQFKVDKTMITNYRSSQEIVDVLNNVYNNAEIIQESNVGKLNIKPKFYVTDQPENIKLLYNDSLILVPTGKEATSDTESIYKILKDFKEYKHNNSKNLKMTDVINFEKSVDPLFQLLNLIYSITEAYGNKDYPTVLSEIKSEFEFTIHCVKEQIIEKMNKIIALQTDITIREFLEELKNMKLWSAEIDSLLDDEKYTSFLNLQLTEYSIPRAMGNKYSTQHGVKGESHDKVVVHLRDSKPIGIYMYDFLDIWAKYDVNLENLENCYMAINDCVINQQILEIESRCSSKTLNADWFNENKEVINLVQKLNQTHSNYPILHYLLQKNVEEFLERKNNSCYLKTNVGRRIIKKMENIITTYKLFYVCLSRAKEHLVVILDKGQASEVVIEKMTTIGFELEEVELHGV